MGDRLRMLRETKNLSPGEIEKRTDLYHCVIFIKLETEPTLAFPYSN